MNLDQESIRGSIEDIVEDPNEEVFEDVTDIADSLPKNSILFSYFESLQARLVAEPFPSEYDRGTFWIEPMAPFFAFRENRNVDYLYKPRVFL